MSLTLHNPDPNVAELFTEASDAIHSMIPEAEIHHVGSTSVKELGGKGIIDIMVAIPNWQHKDEAVQKFKDIGYEHIHKEVNSRIFLSRVGETVKNDVHIHLTYIGSSEYDSLLAFRNYLRNHPEEAQKYARLKREWLSSARGERKIYTNSKNAYIASVLDKAKEDEVIIEIKDQDWNPDYVTPKDNEFLTRKAARGILIDNGKIALLHVSKLNYHKLPGGGLENDETPVEAFKREILEETGCVCTIDDENSRLVTLEWRGKWKLFQISYVFSARVVGTQKNLRLTQEETNHGFKLEWVPFDQIAQVLKQDAPSDYESKFIMRRDAAIINHFKDILS